RNGADRIFPVSTLLPPGVVAMRRVLLGLIAVTSAIPAALTAQLPQPVSDMLRRIYASRDFAAQRFGPARWIENGTAFTTVEPSEAVQGSLDIVRYETATGTRSIYVSARQLIPAGATAPLDIDDFGWSADGTQMLIFTNSQRVWRQN